MSFTLQKALIVPLVLLSLGTLPLKNNNSSSISHAAGIVSHEDEQANSSAFTLVSVENYINRLLAAGCPPSEQAVLIQTLDGQVLVDHNSNTPLNPASVMKLATSYLALKHFGPEYRFKTTAYTTGKIDEASRTLHGDLIIESEGDPNFTYSDAAQLAAGIRSKGIQRIEGRFRVDGPFRFRHQSSLELAYSKLKNLLRLSLPKQIESPTELATAPERIVLAVHESEPLKELLLYMNAHSDNFYADQLGDALGGPENVRAVLLKEFQLQPSSLYISHTSGLSYNRITPRASIAIFRKMINLLKTHQMRIEDIMPVAGVDSGTLTVRLRQPGIVGSIVAKTGTLITTDNGVSALQGVINSERYGPLLFSIINMGGRVHYFRRNQDRFLVELVSELGTPLQAVRTENILAPHQQTTQLDDDDPPSAGRLRIKRVGLRTRQHGRALRYRRS